MSEFKNIMMDVMITIIYETRKHKDIIIAKDNVKITTLDGIVATADESRFYKSLNKLFLFGGVTIYDKERNITLESNEIEFDKKQTDKQLDMFNDECEGICGN